MSVHLILSNNSLRNTTVNCDSLGIHYDVQKSNGIVTVKRWDRKTNTYRTVGEFELPMFKQDCIRLGGDSGEWRVLSEVLHKGSGGMFSTGRTFTGNEGSKQYRWKIRWGQLLLCEDTGQRNEPALVTYYRHRMGKDPSYLEISDSSVMGSLDNIVVMFLIMEKKKRDREKRRRRAAHGGP